MDSARRVAELADGVKTLGEIAETVGLSKSGVKKIIQRHGLPTRRRGALSGEKNHQFVSGRIVCSDGYALVAAPPNHPHCRKRPGRNACLILEHRLVMERKLERQLRPEETVDHIDRLTLHNAPENLRLFGSNAEHLKATARGPRQWSEGGRRNIGTRTDLGEENQPVDTYRRRRARGDVRLRQILLLALQLDKDSPYLSGTRRHLERIGIDPSSRSSLERAWVDLSERWEADLSR